MARKPPKNVVRSEGKRTFLLPVQVAVNDGCSLLPLPAGNGAVAVSANGNRTKCGKTAGCRTSHDRAIPRQDEKESLGNTASREVGTSSRAATSPGVRKNSSYFRKNGSKDRIFYPYFRFFVCSS